MNDKEIQALTETLYTSEDEAVCWEAAQDLGMVAQGNSAAIAALVKLLSSSSLRVRQQAAESLEKIGNETTIAALVKLLDTSQNEDTLRLFAESLGKIDRGNETAIAALVKLLDTSQNEDTLRLVAESLGKVDRGNETAIAALAELLGVSRREWNRRLAVESLGKIALPGDRTAIAALVELLDASQSKSVRRQASESLDKIAQDNSVAILALVELLGTSKDESVRALVTKTLTKIALGNSTAIAALAGLLHTSKDDDIHRLAAKTIGKIAFSGDQSAIAALVELLGNSQNDDARIQAAETLEKIDPGNKTAIATLIELLDASKYSSKKKQAAGVLEIIGIDSSTVIESLRKLLHTTRSEYTRLLVEETLKKIAPDWQRPVSEDNLLLFLQVSRVKETADRYLNLNYREKAKFCYHRIIACLDRLQEGRDIHTRRSLIASYIEIYQRIVAFAIKNRDYKAAFFYAEILRNRYLVERLAQQDAPLPKTVGQELAAEVREAKQAERKRLQAYTDGIGKGWDEERLRELSDAWDKAKENLEEKYARVAQSEPEFIAKTKICPISFAEVQQLLPADTAILEYFFTGEQLFLILILPGADEPLVPKELCSRQSRPGSELEEVARAWVADLSSEDKSKQKTEREKASQDIVKPIDRISALLQFQNLAPYLGDKIKHLIVVPNSYLHLFPIHALWLSDRDRVLDRFSVSYFPNLNVWKICQQRRRRQSRFIGIANPSQDKDLIFAQAEVAAIGQSRRFLEEAKLLQDREISSSAIIQAAAKYNIFHFSGHAEYNFQQPLESYLMLSDNGADNLKLSTIFADLQMPEADLVTLSACCTGVVDAFQPAEEYLGIATGFLLAGAKAVISSQWKVNSIATAFLLDEFYRQFEKSPKAAALQKAQNWLRRCSAEELRERAKSWDLRKLKSKERFRLNRALERLTGVPFENPYYWAGFILTGS